MGLQVAYEWVAEHIDEHGDILEPVFANKLADLYKDIYPDWMTTHPKGRVDIGLVRDASRDFYTEGTEDRQWAYPNSTGEMPEFFDGGSKVPARFAAEWKRHRR